MKLAEEMECSGMTGTEERKLIEELKKLGLTAEQILELLIKVRG